jgi:Transcriptional regulatory protein, C terminal
MGRPRKKKRPEFQGADAIGDQVPGSASPQEDYSPANADEPHAFAEAADWIAELREMYPEWHPPDPYDPVVMREACDEWRESYIEITEDQDHRDFTFLHDLKRFLFLTEILARSVEVNGMNSEPLLIFLRDGKLFSFDLEDRLPTANAAVFVLLERLKLKLEAQQPTAPSQAVLGPDSSQQITTAPPPNQGDDGIVTGVDSGEESGNVDPKKQRDLRRSFNEPVIDKEQFTMLWKGNPYTFKNTKEFKVLAYLATNFGSWVPINSLRNHVWGETIVGNNTVQKTISNLRNKLKGHGLSGELTIDGSNPENYMLKMFKQQN